MCDKLLSVLIVSHGFTETMHGSNTTILIILSWGYVLMLDYYSEDNSVSLCKLYTVLNLIHQHWLLSWGSVEMTEETDDEDSSHNLKYM